MSSHIKYCLEDLREGDNFYVLVNEKPTLAELHTKKETKLLIHHLEWEWIDKSSSRLFPKAFLSVIFLNERMREGGDVSKKKKISAENSSENEPDVGPDLRPQVEEEKREAIKPPQEMQWKNPSNKDSLRLEDILICEKVLLKLCNKPKLLNEPTFKKFVPYIKTLGDYVTQCREAGKIHAKSELLLFFFLKKKLAKRGVLFCTKKKNVLMVLTTFFFFFLSTNQLLSNPHPIKKKKKRKQLEMYHLRMKDFEKQAQTGIRQQRMERKKVSEKFRKLTEAEVGYEETETRMALEMGEVKEREEEEEKKEVTVHAAKNIDDHMFREQVLVTCSERDLEECIEMIKNNTPLANTTAFKVGTLIRDQDGSQRLDLCKQKLGPNHATSIAQVMKHNQCIQALLLGANGIGDHGAKVTTFFFIFIFYFILFYLK
ncbi:leucine rich repeat protein [Reticulomyxa filosa]|uniref:Leucine rich repeat protein n=1 Tax=Reticulomyxa filosa TaxID=46433 RepID=X6P4X0_RETFI|nr:leucine rich repeat protein [Reticulomyxa filosa]|eukprot:ETO33168.1 leucine rich repeat protein [Reticulomyxa filosa]